MAKQLTENEIRQLELQNSRLVSSFTALQLENHAKKHWDLFYKRNETRFFKDRHWTTREFRELLGDNSNENNKETVLLEIGCGVGNLIFPLIEEGIEYFIFACDLSTRAVELVKQNKLYSEDRVSAFQTDITTDHIHSFIHKNSVDIVTLVFVLSALHPDKFEACIRNIFILLKPGGIVLFRDYGLYDMAQLRFKAGHKIADNFYMRQDGTRSYYFSTEKVAEIFTSAGFEIVDNEYIHRRTVNKKEGIDVPRIFVQAKFRKCAG